jgi:hypothetical protein
MTVLTMIKNLTLRSNQMLAVMYSLRMIILRNLELILWTPWTGDKILWALLTGDVSFWALWTKDAILWWTWKRRSLILWAL